MEIFAYLDPGSASALLAAVLAGVAGIGAAIRTFGRNFLDTLMFWKKDEPAVETAPVSTTSTPEDKTPEQ